MLQRAWLAWSEIKMLHRLAESIDHCCACSFLLHNNFSMPGLKVGMKAPTYITIYHTSSRIVMLELHVSVTHGVAVVHFTANR